MGLTTMWALTNYKWSYKTYKCPYKWVTGVITLLIGVTTPFTTIVGAHLVGLGIKKHLQQAGSGVSRIGGCHIGLLANSLPARIGSWCALHVLHS